MSWLAFLASSGRANMPRPTEAVKGNSYGQMTQTSAGGAQDVVVAPAAAEKPVGHAPHQCEFFRENDDSEYYVA